jgi:hypothetical protein
MNIEIYDIDVLEEEIENDLKSKSSSSFSILDENQDNKESN